MQYGITTSGLRVTATPEEREACCPICGVHLVPKCGDIMIWHFAHSTCKECDPWWEPESAWHREWKERVPPSQREVTIGSHRADIVTPSGFVIVLQKSPISTHEIRDRERHYRRMLWLFDCREAYATERFLIYKKRDGICNFHWKHPRRSIAACKLDVFLQLSSTTILKIKRIHFDTPSKITFHSAGCRGYGKLFEVEDFAQGLLGAEREAVGV